MPTACAIDPDGHARRVLEFDKFTQLLSERAQTDGGYRLLQQLTPSADTDTVRAAQTRCQQLRRVTDAGAALPGLAAVVDFRAALRGVRRGNVALSAPELRGIADTLHTASRVQRWLHERADHLPDVILWLGDWPDCTPLVQSIHKAILENGEIADAASARLRDVRTRQTRMRKNLVQRLEKLAQARPADEDSWVTLRGERYVIPVRADAAGSVPGIVHDRSASGVTLFVEPLEVVDANNELQGLHDAEQREIRRILQELTDAVLAQADAAHRSLVALEKLDLLSACVDWARQADAHAPAIGADIQLRQGRHPLLALQLADSGQELVPLDVTLAAGQSLVITGPNTGGKTVALKCLGLLVLMHQSGVPVPAHADSRLPIVTRLIADIGDEQSIESAQSTFSSHMRHVVGAIRDARAGCLVLLDEFMSGTDPQEGAALAKVILRCLVRAGAQTLVTTHLGELKLFAHAEPGIANAAMLFDADSRAPLYRLQSGVPGASNAFSIASRLGLPEELLQEARALRDEGGAALEDAIVALEDERRRLAQARADAETAATEATRARDELQERVSALDGDRKQALAQARAQAAELVHQAQATIENLVRELRETQASRTTIHKVKDSLERLRDETHAGAVDSDASDAMPDGVDRPPQVGDMVHVRTLQKNAVVDDVGRDGALRVRLGSLQMQVHVDDVVVLPEQPATAGGRRRSRASRGQHDRPARRVDKSHAGHELSSEGSEEAVALRLDVRGLDREEALSALDRFLDRALLQGAPVVLIVHGKGTGVLRAGIQAYLADHPRVREHRLGEHGEGGSGVTIVHLD